MIADVGILVWENGQTSWEFILAIGLLVAVWGAAKAGDFL